MGLSDVLQGLAAMRRLRKLQEAYEAGYRSGKSAESSRLKLSDPDLQTAYAAGWQDGRKGHPMRPMIEGTQE